MCGITAGIAEDGELVVKGPLVCKGYHNNPGVTAQQITDGWLHTGDLGDISEDGFISITGRKKDLIITAGRQERVAGSAGGFRNDLACGQPVLGYWR